MNLSSGSVLTAAEQAARLALDEVGADPSGTIVDLRVLTSEQYEVEAMRPDRAVPSETEGGTRFPEHDARGS